MVDRSRRGIDEVSEQYEHEYDTMEEDENEEQEDADKWSGRGIAAAGRL